MNRKSLFCLLVIVISALPALSACASAQTTPIPVQEGGTLPAPSSSLPERSEAEREFAVAAIRAFEGVADLAVTYRGTNLHPENSGMVVENYETVDTLYMVTVPGNMVVYMQRKAVGAAQPGGAQYSDADLEKMVREWLAFKNPCFPNAESLLTFQPGSKSPNYFFRWQASEPDPSRPSDQPTFIQVGITNSGVIFGYVDSGICLLVTK